MYSAAKAAADFAHLLTARGWKLRPCETEAQAEVKIGPQPSSKLRRRSNALAVC
jgi:hypothetical protein